MVLVGTGRAVVLSVGGRGQEGKCLHLLELQGNGQSKIELLLVGVGHAMALARKIQLVSFLSAR